MMRSLYNSMDTFSVENRYGLRKQLEEWDEDLYNLDSANSDPYSYEGNYLQQLDIRYEEEKGHKWNEE